MIIRLIDGQSNHGVVTRPKVTASSILQSDETYYNVMNQPGEDSKGLFAYWRLFVHHKRTILGFVLLGVIAGIVVSIVQTPIYRAHVTMEVQNFNQSFLDVDKVDPTSVNYETEAYLQTQIKLIQSEVLLDRVSHKIFLNGRLSNQSKSNPSPFLALLNL